MYRKMYVSPALVLVVLVVYLVVPIAQAGAQRVRFNVSDTRVVATCTPPPAGMVAWYRGEGNGNDVFGHNATPVGNASANVPGKVGQAFNFDGNGDYYSIDGTFGGTAEATVDAWVKTNAVTPNEVGIQTILGTVDEKFVHFHLSDDNTLKMAFYTNAGQHLLPVIPQSPTGQWRHIAVTLKSGEQKLYVDGVQFGATGTVAYTTILAASNLTIGAGFNAFTATPGRFFNGAVDEVEIFNRALDGTEIAKIYNAGSAGKCPDCATAPSGMVSWWKGENNALDTRGNNNGNLFNGLGFTSGEVGQAFSFNGTNQYIATPDSSTWDLGTGDFSIDSWITTPDSTGVHRIISAGIESDGPNQLWALGYGDIWGGGTRLNFAYWNASPTYVDINSDPITLAPNQWYHVTVVRSGTTMIFYLNGVAVGGGSISGVAINGGTTGGMIGARRNTTFGIYEFTSGKMDEIELFNRALTGPEVAAMYNAGSLGKCTGTGASGPIGWWPGDGDAKDITTNANNGNLIGGTGFTVGKVGQGFLFSGSNEVQVPNLPAYQIQEFSIEAWIRETSTPTNAPIVFGAPGGGYQFALFGTNIPGGNVGGGTQNVGGLYLSKEGVNHVHSGPLTLPADGNFHHVAVTKFGSTVTFYLDGVASAPVTYDPGFTTTNTGLIGTNLTGSLDEVTLYNRPLSASEIQSTYNAGLAGGYKSGTTATGSTVNTNVGSDATTTFQSVTTAGTTQQVPIDMSLLPALPAGATFSQLAYDISTGAAYQNGTAGDVTVCFNVPALSSFASASNLRIYHLETNVWVNRTAGGGTYSNLCTTGLASLSPFAIGAVAAPTAAEVSVSGRVIGANGRAILGARVTVVDPQTGSRKVIVTNPFGYYMVGGLEAGRSYVVSVSAARFRFAESTRVVTLSDNLTDLLFTADQ